MIVGLAMGSLLGCVVDKYQISPILLGCFLTRFVGLIGMTMFIKDFET